MGGKDSFSKMMRKIRNIGIIAHIDAGKTTVTERLLFVSGKIYKMGEVHDGEAVMDYMVQEQERGITITSAVTSFSWRDAEIHLVDTPGHVDFTIEVERCLRVLDGVVVVFDGVNGVEPQSETVWHQADKYGVPRIAFINKMDRVGADFEMCLKMMRERFSQKIVPIQIPVGSESNFQGVVDLIDLKTMMWDGVDPRETIIKEGIQSNQEQDVMKLRDDMIAQIAEFDDQMTDKYLNGEEIMPSEIIKCIRRLTIEGKIVPVLCGSALRNKGIPPLLDAIVNFLPSPLDIPSIKGTNPVTKEVVDIPHDPNHPLCALAYKVQIIEEGRRLTYLRLYSGRIDEKAEVYNSTKGVKEKLSRIFLMHAKERKRLEETYAGNIVAVMGLKVSTTGDTICDPKYPVVLEPIRPYEPVITMAIEPLTHSDKEKLDFTLKRIADEDPTFRFREDPETGQTIISGMGELHLEIVADRITRDFGVPVRTGKPEVVYAETITIESYGDGICLIETEDTKVYAHCCLRVAPMERGKGNYCAHSSSCISPFIEHAKEGVLDALKGGVLHGWPLTDIFCEIEIIEGREGYHMDETAVRIAAMNALKDACEKGQPARLAPIGEIEVIVPSEFLGEVLGTIQARHGLIEDIEDRGHVKVLHAVAPIERMFGYTTELRSVTQGRGTFTMRFARYDVA